MGKEGEEIASSKRMTTEDFEYLLSVFLFLLAISFLRDPVSGPHAAG